MYSSVTFDPEQKRLTAGVSVMSSLHQPMKDMLGTY